MLKPPVGFRGDTGIGALTGLSGVGQQDPFLYEKIPREPRYPEYTHATPYYRFYRPTSTRFLGEEIRHVFRPQNMGDLLTELDDKVQVSADIRFRDMSKKFGSLYDSKGGSFD